MDQLQAIQVFVSIAQHGSLTAAARALERSLPSVVRTLAAMEQRLGVRLFHRSTRRLAITDDGRTYLAHCRRVLAALDDAEAALRQSHQRPEGSLVITAPVRLGEMFVVPLVRQLVAQHPGLRLQLLLLDRVVDLLEEGIDLAVRIAPLPDAHLVARPVGALRHVVCASPALLARAGRPTAPAQLQALPCILFTGMLGAARWTFREDKKKPVTVAVDGRFSSNSVAACLEACGAGLGFGRFLCYQALPAVRRGELEMVLQAHEPAPRPLALLYAQNRVRSAAHRHVADALEAGLREALNG